MSVNEVRAAIVKVQPHITNFDPGPPQDYNLGAPANNHETSTRYMIIDPTLRSLGWDLSDPKDCIVEYKVSAGSQRAADYALLDSRGRPVILIEAKRIDDHTERVENWEQVYGYMLEVPTTRIVAVTNGQYWAIQVRGRGGIWQPEKPTTPRPPLAGRWRKCRTAPPHLDRTRHR